MWRTVQHDLIQIFPLSDFVLQVELADGGREVFDLKTYFQMPGFKSLPDPDYASRVQILCGPVTWPDGKDIAPETLAAEMKSLASA